MKPDVKIVLGLVQEWFHKYGSIEISDLLFELRAEHDIAEETAWKILQNCKLISRDYTYEDYQHDHEL